MEPENVRMAKHWFADGDLFVRNGWASLLVSELCVVLGGGDRSSDAAVWREIDVGDVPPEDRPLLCPNCC